jgi:cyanophycinase
MYHLLFLTAVFVTQPPDPPRGILVIVGGGPTTPEIIKKTLALAGGDKARILIIPQASVKPKAGEASMQMWVKAGAKKVTVLDLKDKNAAQNAIKAIKEANLIWMPGGSQSLLMKALSQHGLAQAIRERFKQGITVGGTSAGAAVMSEIMFTEKSTLDSLTAGAIQMSPGLGLWPEAIIDQHFQREYRASRLLCAILNNPKHIQIGIGIYEGTAVVVQGRSFEVIGKRNVIVIDARNARRVTSKTGQPRAAVNILMHVLSGGDKFDLDKGILLK